MRTNTRWLWVLAAGLACAAGVLLARWSRRRRRLPMLFQVEAAECSLACLAMVAGYHGNPIGMGELRRMHPVSLQGLSLRTIVEIASLLGMKARVLRCDVDDLRRVATPVMLHWDSDHFVVLRTVGRGHFVVHDPSRGIRRLSRSEVSNHFSGIVVELAATDGFQRSAKEAPGLSLRRLIGHPEALGVAVAGVFLLSVVLELVALVQPLLLRSVIDVGVGGNAADIILKVAGIMVIVAVLHGGSSVVRDYAVLRAGTSLNAHIAQRLFRQTLSLPLSFFEKRPIAHLIQRYNTTDQIERFLVSGLPLALIDGGLTVVSLAMLVYLAPGLAAFSLVTVSAFLILQASLYRLARPRQEELIWTRGEQHGHLLESLRTIITTKANALEGNRFSCWLSLYSRQLKAQRQLGLVEVGHRGVRQAIVGINLAMFVLVAASRISHGALTIGTCLAALVYNGQFVTRSQLLVERLFDFRMLRLQLDRLEDIVCSDPEEAPAAGAVAEGAARPARLVAPPPTGEVTIDGVSFAYGTSLAPVLRDVSCRIAPGEMVALVGDNGAGKTTLLKLLLGLYRPSQGRVLYDGVDLQTVSLVALRSHMGSVTQDDHLLTGTVAQNIALFDPEMDMDRVVRAAELACVRQDIERTPMGYSTRLGDLGSPFSEGQKQKIFLARALYREPAIIMMDEGTANLDATSELQILASLAKVRATKILIAHRTATIRSADRVLLLRDGRISEISRSVSPVPHEEVVPLHAGALGRLKA